MQKNPSPNTREQAKATPDNTPPTQTPMETDPPHVSGNNPPQQLCQNTTPPRNHFVENIILTPIPMDTVSSAHTADAPSDGEEGGSHSGPAITNIFTLTSGPEDTLAPPHNAKEAYRRDLEAFPGHQSSRIKLEPGFPQLDIARRTSLDHQWLLEDPALQIVIRDSPELTSNIICELVGEIVHLDDDDSVPQQAVDYCTKKSLERRPVE